MDYNTDGWLDFYVANDGEANQLWENQGNGKFKDQAILAGVAFNTFGRAEAGMGVTTGDADGDGDLDLFLTHLTDQTNTLYLSHGNLGFEDASSPAGLGAPSLPRTGFGTGLFDYDHDGDLDLAIVNGRVMRHPVLAGARLDSYWNPFAEPNFIFLNDGKGRFTDSSHSAGLFASRTEVSRGLAFGDMDNDGDLDLLLTNTAGPARLYRNDSKKKGHWLTVRTVDPDLRRDVHGAWVTVVAKGKAYVRVANPGYSYMSSSDPRAHFGIPDGGRIEHIEVRWADGTEEVFPGVKVDSSIVLEKGRGETKIRGIAAEEQS